MRLKRFLFFFFSFPVFINSQNIIADQVQVPCAIVIFGATGDLTARKILPALYQLASEGFLSNNTAIIGVGRKDHTDSTFRSQMREALDQFSRIKVSDDLWNDFEKKIFYQCLDFESAEKYDQLDENLQKIEHEFGTEGNRLFYLATQPSFFSEIIEKLKAHSLVYNLKNSKGKWSKVIIEKPFGYDLDSASKLQSEIAQYLDNEQIYRMDHYLGKIGVQNLLTLRFENALFEPLWNCQCIDHIQITLAEQIGIGTRAHFWENTGLLRDVFQNHLTQLLAMIAMEPPQTMDPNEIHAEKIKLLKAIRPFPTAELDRYVVRGQYGSGIVQGSVVDSYLKEKGVAPNSNVETFVAAKVLIDNERWRDVPFYVRAGKRLASQMTEIAVVFKKGNHSPFANVLFIRIQPDSGVFLKLSSKRPELTDLSDQVLFGFQLDPYFGTVAPEAYEKLLYACIQGQRNLFVEADEQLIAWSLFTPVLKQWEKKMLESLPIYSAGSWGPLVADELLEKEGRHWVSLGDLNPTDQE